MKKYLALLFGFLLVFSLSACGPSPEEQAETEASVAEYAERMAQADAVENHLNATLGASYEVDLTVNNFSGTIEASVDVESASADRAGLGKIISEYGNHFLSLSEYFPTYDFGKITFRYYITGSMGRRLGDPIVTYSVGDNGIGTMLEPAGNLKILSDKTPDEIYFYLADLSAETRSISNPTPKQKAISPENLFSPAEAEMFSETESGDFFENAFYIAGTVEDVSNIYGFDTIHFSTELGNLYAYATLVPLPEVDVGDQVVVYCTFTEFDKKLDGVSAVYVYHE